MTLFIVVVENRNLPIFNGFEERTDSFAVSASNRPPLTEKPKGIS